jgi:hypothetical protein
MWITFFQTPVRGASAFAWKGKGRTLAPFVHFLSLFQNCDPPLGRAAIELD